MHCILALLIGVSALSGQGLRPYDPFGTSAGEILGIGGGLTIVSTIVHSRVKPFTLDEILALDRSRIPGIDRYSLDRFEPHTAEWTDKLLFASVATPFLVLLTDQGRANFGDASLVLFEGALLNLGIVNLSKTWVRRPRPYNYHPDVPLENKQRKSARYSFVSGHAATSAFFSFSSAKLYNDLYPQSKARPFVWAAAAMIPTMVSYGRMKAGKHFFTDVLVGFAVGTTLAIVVPELNKI